MVDHEHELHARVVLGASLLENHAWLWAACEERKLEQYSVRLQNRANATDPSERPTFVADALSNVADFRKRPLVVVG